MELSLAKPQMLRKPLMLKDYLLDDLSSCSPNGFRTYPRRQCCTTVRFLLEIELKNKPPKYIKKPPLKNPSKPAPSAFQRAINAVKSLPFAAVKSSSSSSSNKLKLILLPRSLSRKLLKRSFWKRNDRKEVQRWEPINQLIVENKSPLSDSTAAGDCPSPTSESNTWSDSDFTASDDSTSGNSEVKISNEICNDIVLVENKKYNNNNNNDNNIKRLPNKVDSSKRVGVIVGGDDSMYTATSSNSSTSSNNIKKWPSEEEKEQFSPVSVLDCPFDDDDDDDDEVSSPFQDRLARTEGSKKRLVKQIKRFERLTQLEPVNLEKRIASSESDHESNESPQTHSSKCVHKDFILDSKEEENQASDKAFKLLQLVKATMPSISLEFKVDHDKLLLDFFEEGMELDSSSPEHAKELTRSVELDNKLLNVTNSWIMGQPRELFLEWEVQKNREAYTRHMERGGTWRKLNEEKQEVALELEVEIFTSLMNELLNDLF